MSKHSYVHKSIEPSEFIFDLLACDVWFGPLKNFELRFKNI